MRIYAAPSRVGGTVEMEVEVAVTDTFCVPLYAELPLAKRKVGQGHGGTYLN